VHLVGFITTKNTETKVTVSIGSDLHCHVTEVTSDAGLSGSHSEYTVPTVTIRVSRDSYDHETKNHLWHLMCSI